MLLYFPLFAESSASGEAVHYNGSHMAQREHDVVQMPWGDVFGAAQIRGSLEAAAYAASQPKLHKGQLW